MQHFVRVARWVDENILTILAGFLIVFIPLYPKWPLFELIQGYIVRVRLEDIVILFTFMLWVVQMLRGKTRFGQTPIAKPIFIYLLIGFLSVLSAMFVTKSLPLNQPHILKLFLHYFRRIEYFSLFFIVFTSIRSMRQVKIFLGLTAATLFFVILYGYGQKYLYWPAFSTMNREFSKGWWLYLTEHARVLSTFGGHYDLAAYLVMMMSLGWAFFFGFTQKAVRTIVGLLLLGSFWLLILTASRTSFISYLVGVVAAMFIFSFWKGRKWAIKRGVAVVLLSILFMLSFGDLSERFTKLLKLDQFRQQIAIHLLRPITERPTEQAIFLENNLEAVTSKSDQPPTVMRPKRQGIAGLIGRFADSGGSSQQIIEKDRPFDVYEDLPLPVVATDPATGTTSVVYEPRTYSPTAMQYDLSTGIRFDALWPRAWRGFLRNPLFGSGYSTLTKETDDTFTEAESTDNDYLRALGETGLFGFIAFGVIIGTILYQTYRRRLTRDPMIRALSAGVFGAVIGLLVNALYIDVFEASKVAYTFWIIVGVYFAAIYLFGRKGVRRAR